jgi:hypothetical protein
MDKDSWKACFGSLRLSQADIKQIIAEHMEARFDFPAAKIKIELWPPKDEYGNDSFANVDMPGYARTTKT